MWSFSQLAWNENLLVEEWDRMDEGGLGKRLVKIDEPANIGPLPTRNFAQAAGEGGKGVALAAQHGEIENETSTSTSPLRVNPLGRSVSLPHHHLSRQHQLTGMVWLIVEEFLLDQVENKPRNEGASLHFWDYVSVWSAA